MTKVEHLVRSCFNNTTQNILLDTEYATIISKHLNDYNISIFNRLNIFASFDTIIIDQSNMSKIEDLYKKFLSNIIIIDNVSHSIDLDNTQYWQQLKNMHDYYNNTYKAIFITLDQHVYIKANYSHSYLININEAKEWRSIV